MGASTDEHTAHRPDLRWVGLAVLAAAALIAAVVALATRSDVPTETTPSSYDLEVVLGTEQDLAALWAVGVNGYGSVAAGAALDADRVVPGIVLTDGHGHVVDLSAGRLAGSAVVHGVAVDDRANVLAVDEFGRGGSTRRRAAMWSPRAPGQPRVLSQGAWSVAGEPSGDTVFVPGRRPALAALGPAVTVIDISEGTRRARHHLLDATGELSDAFTEAPLDEEPIRPAVSADGTAVVSTGNEVLAIEPGTRRTVTIAGREHGFARLGVAAAASEDGRLVAFVADRGEGPALYGARRLDDGHGWSPPVHLEGPEPATLDEPIALTSIRHPPEIGDIGLVVLRGTMVGDEEDRAGTGSGETALWTLALHDTDDARRALEVADVRVVVRAGDRIDGRSVTAILTGVDVAAPAEHATARDDHWLAFGIETDAGPLVIRAVPRASDLVGRARELDDLRTH